MRAFAAAQQPDGYVREKMGHRSTPLDHPRGRMMGDGNTCFVLELYQDYLWSGDRAFLAPLWPVAKRALQWQMRRADRYGLPARLNNSYDWFFFADKDLVSYNAFLHLAALKAGKRLATVAGDDAFADACDRGLAVWPRYPVPVSVDRRALSRLLDGLRRTIPTRSTPIPCTVSFGRRSSTWGTSRSRMICAAICAGSANSTPAPTA